MWLRSVKMFGKKFLGVMLVTVYLALGAGTASAAEDIPPQVFLNDSPAAITVERGAGVAVPIILAPGMRASDSVEVYAWRQEADGLQCLGSDGLWHNVPEVADCSRLGWVSSLPSHLYIRWPAFNGTESLENCLLGVCLDYVVDGTPTSGALYCDSVSIVIKEDTCTGKALVADPATEDLGSLEVGAEKEFSVTVTDEAGEPVSSYNAIPDSGWLTVVEASPGEMLLRVTTNGLTAGTTYNGTVSIETTDGCEIQTRVPVKLTMAGGGTLTAPSFPILVPDDDTCSILKFTPEDETFSSTSISKTLELGQSTSITLLTSACGQSVTVSSVSETSDEAWLSASKGGGSEVVLKLDAGASGLQAGSTDTGTVKVVAGGITQTLSVTLRIEGSCEPSSASAPASLSLQAYLGADSTTSATFSVKNNCGNVIESTVVSSKPDWVAISKSGTGSYTVSADSSGHAVNTYTGSIVVQDGVYDEKHTVTVTLRVTEEPVVPSDDSVPTVTSGHDGEYDMPAGGTRYFKLVAGVEDCHHPIQVANTPMSGQPTTVQMIIKRGSKPTISDYEFLKNTACPGYDCDTEQYVWSKPAGAEDIFWRFGGGTQGKLVEIREPQAPNTFYIMFYNAGTTTVRDQRLTVYY
jgi:hypothetical protein